jgi:hypothetical protein
MTDILQCLSFFYQIFVVILLLEKQEQQKATNYGNIKRADSTSQAHDEVGHAVTLS